MTIKEAIEFKKHGYHTSLSSFENIDDMNAHISKCAEYDRLALETMRKYQKIEEIVGRYGFESSWLCLRKIREVVGDDE